MKIFKSVMLSLLVPMLFFAGWWLASAGSASPYFPPLSASLVRFRELWLFANFDSDLLPSVRNFLAGFGAGAALGVVAGTVMGISPRLRRAISPLTEFARAMPIAALVPVGLVVFGPGAAMESSLIGFASFFPVLLASTDGVRAVDPVPLEMARAFGLSVRQRIFRVVLPAALPQIMAGLRISLAIGLAAMVIANMFGADHGIGYVITNAQSQFDVTSMWAGILMIGLLGCVVNGIFAAIEHRALRWHRGWRGRGIPDR